MSRSPAQYREHLFSDTGEDPRGGTRSEQAPRWPSPEALDDLDFDLDSFSAWQPSDTIPAPPPEPDADY